MPIIRGHHDFDERFTQIPNFWLRDGRLSLKARGLISLIMSHREDWSLSINRLAAENNEGKHAIRAAVAELEKLGYLIRSQENDKRFGESVWMTSDPFDYPLSDIPLSENPLSENQHTKNTTSIEEHLEEEKIKKNNIHELFDEFWKEYPRKVDRAQALRAFKSALKRAKFEDLLAGAIAYKHDETRKPEYTKYPATWLNADAWENQVEPAPGTVAYEKSQERRRKALEESKAYLAEQQVQALKSAPAPQCEHGKNLLLCRKCLK